MCVSFTWSLEVDASHLHGVCGVVGRDVGVVQQALGPRLRLFPFATAERPGDKKSTVRSAPRGPGWGVGNSSKYTHTHKHTQASAITNVLC